MERYQPRIHLVELADCDSDRHTGTGRAAPRIKVAVSSTAVAVAAASVANRGDAGAGSCNLSKQARDEAKATSGSLQLEVDTALTPSESESDSLGIEHVLHAVGALASGRITWRPVAVHTFLFRQLRFIAVTAYQNQLVRITPLPIKFREHLECERLLILI